MIAARSIVSGLGLLYTRFFLTFFGSLLGCALFVPAVAVLAILSGTLHAPAALPLGIALLLGVLPCPTAIGVHSIAQGLATGDYVFFGAQRAAFADYWRVTARLWLVGIVVSIVLIGNVTFYAHLAFGRSSMLWVSVVLLVLWIMLSLFWLSMHLYVFPLIFAQESPGVRVVYRNAALLAVARPFTTWAVVPVWCLLLLVGSATGLVAAGGLMMAAGMQQQVTTRILREMRTRAPLERVPREELQ